MYMFKLLCLGLLAILPLTDPNQPAKECGEITADIKISEETDGNKIVLIPKGGQAPYKYIFSRKSGELVSEDFNNNTAKGLEKGKYFCTVVDKKYCKKNFEIEIK
jgi:hypothetical protein